MGDSEDSAPLYVVQRSENDPENWRVIGPNGFVGAYKSASEAQAKADLLNEQIAEGTEDDF